MFNIGILMQLPRIIIPNDSVKHILVMDYNQTDNTGVIVDSYSTAEEAKLQSELLNDVVIDHSFSVVGGVAKVVSNVKYCEKCGNSGFTIDREPCDCSFNPDTFFSETSCISLPEQYRGLTFSQALVPNDLDGDYRGKLQELYTNISTARCSNHNYLICSPHKHSKSVFAYCCIERLFRASVPVFGVYDIMEVRKIMRDVDTGKDCVVCDESPDNIWIAPYMFVKLPTFANWEVFDTIHTLVSRRVRRGHSTIFMYSGSYSSLLRSDKQDTLLSMKGDGAYSTLDVLDYKLREHNVEE